MKLKQISFDDIDKQNCPLCAATLKAQANVHLFGFEHKIIQFDTEKHAFRSVRNVDPDLIDYYRYFLRCKKCKYEAMSEMLWCPNDIYGNKQLNFTKASFTVMGEFIWKKLFGIRNYYDGKDTTLAEVFYPTYRSYRFSQCVNLSSFHKLSTKEVYKLLQKLQLLA